MDPMMMMMLASLAKEAIQGPKPIMPTGNAPAAPQMQPIRNIPTFTGGDMGGGVPGGIDPSQLSHTMGGGLAEAAAPQEGGAFSPQAPMPGAAQPAVASPLDGISKLGAGVTADDFALGAALTGAGGVPGAEVGGVVDPMSEGSPELTAPPVAPPVPGPTTTPPVVDTGATPAGPGKAGLDMKSFLSGLQGVKAPPPVTPIMHGGNTGGAKPPESTAKIGQQVSGINPIWQLLFGGGAPKGLPVPALGQLLRGA